MSGDIELALWLHKYKLEALAFVLADQGTNVEKRMDKLLYDLYTETVSADVQEDIQNRINEEFTAMEAELEATQTYTAFRVRERGQIHSFRSATWPPIKSLAYLKWTSINGRFPLL